MMDFINIRKYYILISQLLGASYCIYFILNVQHYEVSWTLLSWAFPKVANAMNNLLSSIGTLILIIPLTIIIMSLLIPESYKLRLASIFFGTASTIFLIVSGFIQNTLGEVYNMRIFLITKILTLEEKQNIFKTEFTELIENYRNNLRLFNYLSQLMLEKYFTVYDAKLILLKEKLAIKLYAQDILERGVIVFNNAVTNEQYVNHMQYTAYALYTMAGIVVTLIAFVIIRSFIDTNALIEGAKLARDSAVLGARGNKCVESTQEIAQQGLVLTKELCVELVKVAIDLQSENVQVAFQNVHNNINLIKTGLADLSNVIKTKLQHD